MGHHDSAFATDVTRLPAGFTRLSYNDPTSTGAYPLLVAYAGQATTFNLYGTIYGPRNTGGSAVTTWELRSFATGLVAASGGAIAAGGTWTKPANLPCGAYRLYLFNGAGQHMGGGMFVNTRQVAGMPAPPPSPDSDAAAASWLLLGGKRHQIQNAANPSADYARVDSDVAYEVANYLTVDTARPKHIFLDFPNGTVGASANVQAVVNRYPQIDYFEPANEPNGIPDASFAPEQLEFYNAVKAARPSAKVLTGPTVSIGLGNPQTRLRSFYSAGGGEAVDVISVHTYNSHMGDLPSLRRSWDGFVGLLTEFGLHTKPRFGSEAGSFFAAEYGAGNYMRQAAQTMLDLLGCEQYGIQKESFNYFYPEEHGFDSHPSYYSSMAQMFPMVGCVLTHSQELYGTAYEARLDFGTIDNDLVIGSRYRRADSTGVVSLMSPGKRNHPVTLEITGGSPASLVVVDCWGNQSTAMVTGGLATVTATTLPIYVRLPAGVTATPTGGTTRWGAKRTTGATARVGNATGFTVAFTDTFTRADGAIGNGWTTSGAGTVSVINGQLGKTGGQFADTVAVRDLAAADGRISLTVSDDQSGLVFRYTDNSNYWTLFDNRLIKVAAGVATNVATGQTAGAQLAVLSGSTISVYGTRGLLWTGTDTHNQTATKHGVHLHTTTTRADDFSFSTGTDGSYGAGTLAQVLNGPYQNSLVYDYSNNGDTNSVWNAANPLVPGSPQTITVTLAAPAFIDRVLVHCPAPWQTALTVILDADVQALEADGTTWTTVGTISQTPTVVPIPSSKQEGANSWWDSYWDDQHVFEVAFTRRQTTAFRLLVRTVTYGGVPTLDALNAYGQTDEAGQPVTAGMGTTTPRIALQRLAAYDSDTVVIDPPPSVGIVGTGKYVVRAA